MNLPHYSYLSSNGYFDYTFYSEGPNGRIKKLVTFSKMRESLVVYNLAFGDEDPDTGALIDSVTTNNQDRDKVLATVAHKVIDFCTRHGNYYIYAEGSSPARTRLYQISISNLLDEINKSFKVYGFKGRTLYRFERNVNYDAFLVKRR